MPSTRIAGTRSRARLAGTATLLGSCLALLLSTGGVASAADGVDPTGWSAPARITTYAPLTTMSATRVDARITEYVFSTPYLPAPTYVRVMTPVGYRATGSTRYPMLMLLNGCCNPAPQSRDWTAAATKGKAESATRGAPFVTVMPDDGLGGMYTDWNSAGALGRYQWESYLIGQLLPWVDAHYRTVGSRAGRAIAGLSMGGFGSMELAARHPDLFAAAASFSGIVDNNTHPELPTALSAFDGATPESVWGDYATNQVVWRGHNPSDLADNLRTLSLTLRTGNGMPGPLDTPATLQQSAVGAVAEAAVHDDNVSFHNVLVADGIAHIWDDYGPGTHTWPYWNRDLTQTLPVLTRSTQRASDPASFSFTSIDPTFEDYGYRVTVHRQVTEFATLTGVTRHGFSLTGSGAATVVTAPRYTPGATYHITSTHEAARNVVADRGGRLHLSIDLGPSNTQQQYAPGSTSRTSVTDTVRIFR